MNEIDALTVLQQQQAQINALTQHAQQTSAYLGGAHSSGIATRVNAEIDRGIDNYPMALNPGERRAVSALVGSRVSANPQLAAKIVQGDVSSLAEIAEEAAAEIRPKKSSVARSMDDMWDEAAEGWAKDAMRQSR